MYKIITPHMLKYAVILLPFVLLTACQKDDPEFEVPTSLSRTVLVYLGTDNNFSAEAADKIEVLRTNWDRDTDGNLLVYADAGGKPVLVHIYHHPQKGNVADTLVVYPNENSASPAVLTRVLNDVSAYRPAASYGLVVLSHASGWLPAGMSKPSPLLKSIIWDTGTQETDNYMELADFATAIPYRLDFIVFDACLMGAAEVCYELKDKADYIVASPAEVLSPGFAYSSMMKHLFRPQADLIAVARDFYEYYNNQSGLYRSATVCVVKTAELENLKASFQAICAQSSVEEDLEEVQTFGYGQQNIYFDLGDYVRKLPPGEYATFQTELDKCIVYKAYTDYYYSAGKKTLQPIRAFSGLSVYIPRESYPLANKAYAKLKWTERGSE
jgi:hypothetical protein